MWEYSRIIFVGQSGTAREPMAKGIFEDCTLKKDIEVLARGLVVQFPEPMNQKAEAVLAGNGIELADFSSVALSEEDITDNTLILTMERVHKERILGMFENIRPDQVQVLTEYVGEELEVVDPYGGSLQSYGLCFEMLRKTIQKLVRELDGGEAYGRNEETGLY